MSQSENWTLQLSDKTESRRSPKRCPSIDGIKDLTQSEETRTVGNDVRVVTARPRAQSDLLAVLRRLAAESHRPLRVVIADYIRTSFGPGRLSFDEFIALRLFDANLYGDADLGEFVGLGAMRGIWAKANFQLEFYDVMRNKIAMTAMLEAHGFPSIPIKAIFSTDTGFRTPRHLRSRDELRAFLTAQANYPLFGKPLHGLQSLGSAGLARYDEANNMLVSSSGAGLSLDEYIADVAIHYADGYFFQQMISPHPETKAICGDRLATVRVMTMLTSKGPEIWRACEKLPAGANVADNYWRSGNILAHVDVATGQRGAAMSGVGFTFCECALHPDSGAPIGGSFVPNWPLVREVALEGARLFNKAALIGWDIAPVESGAVIVEANITPDLILPQLASRRGALDSKMRGFLKECAQANKVWIREARRETIESYRPSWM